MEIPAIMPSTVMVSKLQTRIFHLAFAHNCMPFIHARFLHKSPDQQLQLVLSWSIVVYGFFWVFPAVIVAVTHLSNFIVLWTVEVMLTAGHTARYAQAALSWQH